MADSRATTGELYEAGVITAEEIDIAIAAAIASPDICAYPIRDGFLLNLGAAIQAHGPAAAASADPTVGAMSWWGTARTAILLARPEKS